MKRSSQGIVTRWCLFACAAGSLAPAPLRAALCDNTSVGLTPLSDLGSGLYLGQFPGGLYPGGLNVPPPAHDAEGLARGAAIAPLDSAGVPDPAGKIVLLSIGMSNTTQEFCSHDGFEPCTPWSFMGQAAADPTVNHTTLVIVNGARGGQSAVLWDSPTDPNYDRVLTEHLAPRALTEDQVQVVWVKQANPTPQRSLPDPAADALALETSLGDIARAVQVRYPNCRMIFFSSRIYGGYASTPLNPEPFAYETAFSVKWLIEAQINQMAGGGIDPVAGDLDYNATAPWLAWGPYLWADGLIPRSDGLIWQCADFEPQDGTHPAMGAEQKVGTLLLDFMLTSPFIQPWFVGGLPPGTGDCDGDGDVDPLDYAVFYGCLTGPGGAAGPGCVCIDADADGDGDLADFAAFQRAYTGPGAPPATDDFERPALGPDWLVVAGAPQIVSASDLGVGSAGVSRVAWQGSVIGTDQYCEIHLAADWAPSGAVQVSARVDPPAGTGYAFRAAGSGQLLLLRETGAGAVTLASTTGPAPVPGDTMRIEVQGGLIRGMMNGAVVVQAADTTLTSGTAGISFSHEGTTPAPIVEFWTGGSLPP